ncbi:hypothetical protein IZ6_22200 [Terrihabitans soli]|uniref:Methyltransferase type 11 domain-containing protein n=1 Tax=Terrihabitans soli TaxID=708113 RepID=A0A6S6QV99_9HYPH|nr:class I SAM-dependent methyltransferase [Terrihabitans soli]BCJ91485.1 hypothetical protein IZ6_22200 [Terrihabitans soli]
MSVEAERFSSAEFMPPWVRYEHHERYRFAARFVKDIDVVDCACGVGEGTALFAQSGARTVQAFDLSDHAVDAARENCRDFANVTVALADALHLPLTDASADIFISLETFEHLPDQSAFLKEVDRVLKPGGSFICSTPNRRVYNPGQNLEARPWNRFHLKEYETAEFAKILGERFSRVELYGQNPVSTSRAATMDFLGRTLPGHSAVRLNQALKLPRFVFDRPDAHAVQKSGSDTVFEYDVAVCRK